MKRTTNLFGLGLAMLAVTVWGLTGCGGSSSNPASDGDEETVEEETTDGDAETEGVETGEASEEVQSLIDEGRLWLELGQATEAREPFRQALALDGSNLEAHFGLALAESQMIYEFFTSLLSLVNYATGGAKPDWAEDGTGGGMKAEDDPQNDAEMVSRELHRWLGLLLESTALADTHYRYIMDAPDAAGFSFVINEEIPVYQSMKKTAWLKGRFALADVYMMNASLKLLESILEILHQLDVSGDLFDLVNIIMAPGGSGRDNLSLPTLLPMIVDVLNSDERFLSYQDGPVTAGAAMKGMWRDGLNMALKATDLLEAEGCVGEEDLQPKDRVFFCFDHIRYGKQIRLHLFKPDTASEEPDAETEIFLTVLPFEDKQAVADLRDNLTQGGTPLSLEDSLLKPFATAFAVANAFGILEVMNLDLGLGEAATPTVIASVVSGLLPKGMALDFGAFFDNPLSIRQILPAWTSDRPTGENTLLVEWECPDELTSGVIGFPNGKGDLLCEADSEENGLTDSAHFVGTASEQPADGMALGSPYFVWQDPAMGGLLYVDEDKLGISDQEGYQPATQKSMNLLLGTIIQKVMGFLSKK